MNTNEDFKELYEKYLRFSIRIAKKIVGDKNLAEDISQDVFYHLYSISETIDLEDERKLRALITTATVNKAKDYFKKRYVKAEVFSTGNEELNIEAPGESLEEHFLKKEELYKKRRILQKLREKNPMNYEILIKIKYLDMSPDDVAKEYGITRNNVNNRILRTRMWLNKELLSMKDD